MTPGAAEDKRGSPDIETLLRPFPIRVELPVVWGEMDTFGHVNNIVYFRYFESGRMAYFEEAGFGRQLAETGIGPILAATSCVFKAALTYPDTVTVGASVDMASMAGDRFTMHYLVVSHAQARVAAKGDGLVVSYDYRRNKKAALPASVRAAISAIEKR